MASKFQVTNNLSPKEKKEVGRWQIVSWEFESDIISKQARKAKGRFSLKIQIKLNPFIFIIFNGAPAVQQKDYSYLCISFVFCFHPLFHCNMLIIFLFLFVNEILMVLCFYISFCSFSFLPGISFGSFSFEKPMKDMGIKEKIKEIKRKTQAARNSGLTMKNTIFNLDFS